MDCTQVRFHKGLHAKHPAVATSHLFHTGHGPNSGKMNRNRYFINLLMITYVQHGTVYVAMSVVLVVQLLP